MKNIPPLCHAEKLANFILSDRSKKERHIFRSFNRIWYDWIYNSIGFEGGRLVSREGGDAMEVKDALALMISFATLIVLILSFFKKK